MQQFLVRVNDALMDALDGFVDNKRFKSRNQMINTILTDWIVQQWHPTPPEMVGVEQNENMGFVFERKESRKELLGDDYHRYIAQETDLLDGEWEERQAFEKHERETSASEQRKQLKEEIRKELYVDFKNELSKLAAELKKAKSKRKK